MNYNGKKTKPLYPHRNAETLTLEGAQVALDHLVSIGLAWKGADGRYRHIDEGKDNPQ